MQDRPEPSSPPPLSRNQSPRCCPPWFAQFNQAEQGPYRALGLSEGSWSPASQSTAVGHCDPPASVWLHLLIPKGPVKLPRIHLFSGRQGTFPTCCLSALTRLGRSVRLLQLPVAEVLLEGLLKKTPVRTRGKFSGSASFLSIVSPGLRHRNSSIQHNPILICPFLACKKHTALSPSTSALNASWVLIKGYKAFT